MKGKMKKGAMKKMAKKKSDAKPMMDDKMTKDGKGAMMKRLAGKEL